MTDIQIRLFAFDWLKSQIEIHGDTLPRKLLQEGFSISGIKYGLVGPQGIWKPKAQIRLRIILSTYYNTAFNTVMVRDALCLDVLMSERLKEYKA